MGIVCLFLNTNWAVHLITPGFFPKWNIWGQNTEGCWMLELCPDLDESSPERGWEQAGGEQWWLRGAFVIIYGSAVFWKGPFPNGDSKLEHCVLLFSTGSLKQTVIVDALWLCTSGIFSPSLLSHSRCLIHTEQKPNIIFKPHNQHSQEVGTIVRISQMGRWNVRDVQYLTDGAGWGFQMQS